MGLTRPKYNNLDTTIFKLKDPIIEINSGLGDAAANTSDLGFVFKRGTSGDNAAMLWDRSESKFVFGLTTATGDADGNITMTGSADIVVNSIATDNLNFPTVDGTNGQAVITDGAGNLSIGEVTIPTVDGGTY